MAIHAFVRLLDEQPLSIVPTGIEIDAGPLQCTAVLGGQFEIEIDAGPLQATCVLIGNPEIDCMVYARPLIARTQLKGRWYPGTATDLDSDPLTCTAVLKGSYSDGNSEVEPLRVHAVLHGKVRITPSPLAPYYLIELRSSDGDLKYVFGRNIDQLRWENEPRTGGCKSAAFTLIDPPAGLDEEGLSQYDMRIMVDTGSGIDCWWRGYLLNPRLVQGEPYEMEFSALGWVGRLATEAIVGLGFPVEDGGVQFRNLDAAEIARRLIDRINVTGAAIDYDYSSVPDSGYIISSIQFNSSILDAIRTLAELAGEAEWGIDRRKRFYFRAAGTETDHVFFIGRDTVEMVHDFNHDSIVNRLYLFGAGSRRWVIEGTDDITASVSQATDNATLAFGKATSNQRVVQAFATDKRTLSVIDLKIGKSGWGSNLVVDGDMELNDGSNPPNWRKVWDRSRRRKVATGAAGGSQCLEVRHNRTGRGRYGVYQDIAVTPDQRLLFSCQVRDPEREDIVTVDIIDGETGDTPATNADPIIMQLQGVVRNTDWHRLSGTFTPSTNSIGLRFWSRNRLGGTGTDPFYIDDVRLSEGSDIRISIIEQTATTPVRFDEDNPLATATIPFEDIPDSPTALRIFMAAYPLNSAKNYGILVEVDGELSDSQFFLLAYHNTVGSGLYKDDGTGWTAVTGSAYHVIYLPTSQATLGVRSITMARPQLDNDDDALLFGQSFLAGHSMPTEAGFVRLKPNRNVLIEEDQPVKLVRIAKGKDMPGTTERAIDFSLRPELIVYQMVLDGLETSIDLGQVRPRIASVLKYFEYLLSLRE